MFLEYFDLVNVMIQFIVKLNDVWGDLSDVSASSTKSLLVNSDFVFKIKQNLYKIILNIYMFKIILPKLLVLLE